MTLTQALAIAAGTLTVAREAAMKPLAVVVLDARGALKAASVEDGTSLKRAEIAQAKAYGALAMGMGSRALHARVEQQPYFMAAVSHVVGGQLIPVPGGVLIRDGVGMLLGAVGVSGDTSDNDERAAATAIAAAGLTADTGA